ncbi:MAG: hypothetical protein Q9N34_01720 [Aquificota bacterium]|nr:hypothetical protein [Aquificota bacterium]
MGLILNDTAGIRVGRVVEVGKYCFGVCGLPARGGGEPSPEYTLRIPPGMA